MNHNVFIIAASLLMVTLLNFPSAAQEASTTSSGTQVLTLDECLSIAMSNNIALRQVRNNTRIAKANDFQSIMNYLPSVSGFGNYNWNNGTSFDNSSGQFFTGSRESSFMTVNAELVLFNGFRTHYNKKANSIALDASLNSIKAQEQVIQSSVLGSYLSVVLDKEAVKISKARIELLKGQLEREKKREEVGVGNLEQVYNFQSQLANENLNLITRENQYQRDLLGLVQSLGMTVSKPYKVAPYIFEDEKKSFRFPYSKVAAGLMLASSLTVGLPACTDSSKVYLLPVCRSKELAAPSYCNDVQPSVLSEVQYRLFCHTMQAKISGKH